MFAVAEPPENKLLALQRGEYVVTETPHHYGDGCDDYSAVLKMPMSFVVEIRSLCNSKHLAHEPHPAAAGEESFDGEEGWGWWWGWGWGWLEEWSGGAR